MKEISEKEVNELAKQSKEETRKIIEAGGKLTKTIIEEKDKTTTIVKTEPVNGKPTSSTIVQNKNEFVVSCF